MASEESGERKGWWHTTSKRFLRNLMYRGASQLAMSVRGLVFLPIISKSLGAEAYGIWSQIMITLTLLVPVARLRLEMAAVRYFPGRALRSVAGEFSTMLLILWVLVGLLSVGILLLRSEVSAMVFGGAGSTKYVVYFTALLYCRVTYEFLLSLFRAFEQIGVLALAQISHVLVEVAVVSISVLVYQRGIDNILVALIILDSLFSVGVAAIVIRRIGPVSLAPLRRVLPYLRYSLPLVPSAALFWCIDSSDRYVIAHYMGIESVAVYSAWYRIAQLATVMMGPIAFVLFPTISRLWAQKDTARVQRYLESSVRYYLLLAVPAALGVWALTPALGGILATEGFAASQGLVLLLVSSMVFVGIYQLWVYLLHLGERTRMLVAVFGSVAAVNLALNFVLVPHWGLLGAALATFVAYSVQFAVVWILARRVLRCRLDVIAFAKSVIAAVAMGVVVRQFHPGRVPSLIAVVLLGVVVYVLLMVFMKGIGRRELKLIRSALKR